MLIIVVVVVAVVVIMALMSRQHTQPSTHTHNEELLSGVFFFLGS